MNFKSKKPTVENTEPPAPTKAQAFGLKEPPLTDAQKAGAYANAIAASQTFQAKIAKQEQFQRERADFQKAREDALWAKILERQTV